MNAPRIGGLEGSLIATLLANTSSSASVHATASPPVAVAAGDVGGTDRLRSHYSRTRRALMALGFVVALAGCGGSDEPSVEDLFGTWNASFGPTWVIEAERISVSGGAVREISYVVTGDTTIRVSDGSGCPTGTYDWQIEEDVLTLTVVGDDCAGRRDNWDGATFDRID